MGIFEKVFGTHSEKENRLNFMWYISYLLFFLVVEKLIILMSIQKMKL